MSGKKNVKDGNLQRVLWWCQVTIAFAFIWFANGLDFSVVRPVILTKSSNVILKS